MPDYPPALHRGPTWLIAAIALIGAAVVLGPGASAQDPATRTLTFKELAKGSTFTHIRNAKTKSRRSNSQGDLIALTWIHRSLSGFRLVRGEE